MGGAIEIVRVLKILVFALALGRATVRAGESLADSVDHLVLMALLVGGNSDGRQVSNLFKDRLDVGHDLLSRRGESPELAL